MLKLFGLRVKLHSLDALTRLTSDTSHTSHVCTSHELLYSYVTKLFVRTIMFETISSDTDNRAVFKRVS